MIIIMCRAIKAILADEDMKLAGFGPQGHEREERERESERAPKSENNLLLWHVGMSQNLQ